MRQWALNFPFQLRLLFASQPQIMGRVLGIVYRIIAAHLIKKAGQTRKMAHTSAIALIQRFGPALNLSIHFHMLFLDGVYVDNWKGTWFRWVKSPTSTELTQLTQVIARRIGRYFERQGMLESEAESSYSAGNHLLSVEPLLSHLAYKNSLVL